jgi:hypothetical protein
MLVVASSFSAFLSMEATEAPGYVRTELVRYTAMANASGLKPQ